MIRDLTIYAAIFLLGLLGVVLAPAQTTIILIGLMPVVSMAAIVGVLYLGRIYRRQPEPRPRFFRMMLSAQTQKVLLAVPLAYLAVAYLAQNVVHLPSLPARSAGGFTVLVMCLLLTPPIQYAIEVWRARRGVADADVTDNP